VARGLVSFALGTDTAGSGRVPAGFNNIVGLKPTKDLLGTMGVVPACRSLDCVSVFALTCEDAATVTRICAGRSTIDGIRNPSPADVWGGKPSGKPRIGIPREEDLSFFGDDEAASKYRAAVEYFRAAGHSIVEFDFTPFARTARLLYEGPWVAERMAAVKHFMSAHPEAMLPVTRSIIGKASNFDAVATFEALYQLRDLQAEARGVWDDFDVMLLPTSGTIYRFDQVEAEPVQLNTNLGYYTNFVNLLDLCALAVPNGFRSDGLPTGVTLLAPAGRDEFLVPIGDAFHRATTDVAGATGRPIPEGTAKPQATEVTAPQAASVELAVVGAHLSGQPLNSQLTSRGAALVRSCKTAPTYRLYALANTVPPKPGLVRVETGGRAIEVEVWSMTAEAFGSFVAAVPAPMTIGTATLEDDTTVKGFLCEPIAIDGAQDISSYGGWRAFLAEKK
jgi:allophanate hydrolase